jgi:hypothetical protein
MVEVQTVRPLPLRAEAHGLTFAEAILRGRYRAIAICSDIN